MNKTMYLVLIFVLCLLVGCQAQSEKYEYVNADISVLLNDAKSLYEQKEYEEALKLYLEAMNQEPKDVDARIGTVKCQFALKNYDMAVTNLRILSDISPNCDEIYALYLDISKDTNSLYYANYAIDLAKKNAQNSFLSKIPKEPAFNYAGGNYQEKIQVELSTDDSDAKIYYLIKNDQLMIDEIWSEYIKPIILPNADSQIMAYCVSDGIPSETVTMDYRCEYSPTQITFQEPVIEQLVRKTLGKSEGVITDLDCMGITELDTYDLYDGVSYEEYKEVKIHSLSDLGWMPYLNYLSLNYQTEIEDYSIIADCSRIIALSIQESEIEDIHFISEMPTLRSLTLSKNEISDITPILACKELNSIHINGNPVPDVASLAVLKNINYISFDSESLSDYSILSQKEDLYGISIYGLEGIGFDELGKLKDLKQLSIDYGSDEDYSNRPTIDTLDFLEHMTGLTSLSMSGVSDSSQLEHLFGLKNLQTLSLYNCDVTKDEAAMSALRTALPICTINGD